MQLPERHFRNSPANPPTLLETVIAYRVPLFVFSSNAALYGDPERTPKSEM